VAHPEALRLQAYFDAELDAMGALEVEQHVQHCDACGAQLHHLGSQRLAFREALPGEPAPAALRRQIDALLTRESTPERRPWLRSAFWLGNLTGGVLVAAATATVAMLGWLPRPTTAILHDELVSAYVRSMVSSHSIDVASSDHHTVKPWFAGHADVSPVVADFEVDGYRLIGGRAEYLDHQRAAVLVYQHDAHTIDVFSWAAGTHAVPATEQVRDGYHVSCWRAADLDYCAVSDTGWNELHALRALLQALSAHD
jgi:anti-sigma factor RsiW